MIDKVGSQLAENTHTRGIRQAGRQASYDNSTVQYSNVRTYVVPACLIGASQRTAVEIRAFCKQRRRRRRTSVVCVCVCVCEIVSYLTNKQTNKQTTKPPYLTLPLRTEPPKESPKLNIYIFLTQLNPTR